MDAARADPRFQAAILARGIRDMAEVYLETWPFGSAVPDNVDGDRRLVWTPLWHRPTPEANVYAHPISGLRAIVDLDTSEVLAVEAHALDLDRVLADLAPSVRAIIAPIVLVLKALIEGLQQELARKDARIEQLLRTIYGRKSEQVPDPKREARKRVTSKRTPEEREAARQEAREKTRKQRAELPFVEKKISVPDEDRVCEACGGTDLHALGEGEVSEQIELGADQIRRHAF